MVRPLKDKEGSGLLQEKKSISAVCPRSLVHFYIVSILTILYKTSRTHGKPEAQNHKNPAPLLSKSPAQKHCCRKIRRQTTTVEKSGTKPLLSKKL